MVSAAAEDCGNSQGPKPNLRKFAIFIALSMFCFVAGIISLNLESGSSVQVDIKNEAYQIYDRQRQKLDAIVDNYARELAADRKSCQ